MPHPAFSPKSFLPTALCNIGNIAPRQATPCNIALDDKILDDKILDDKPSPPHPSDPMQSKLKSLPIGRLGVMVGCLLAAIAAPVSSAEAIGPTKTAPKQVSVERIYVTYGILERFVPVAELEAYAKDGIKGEYLSVYAQYAGPEELKQLRNVLNAKADLSHVVIANFLYSPQGEEVLKRLGQVIKPESRQPDFKFIRAAVIEAAADSEGLTVLNFLRHFRSKGLRVDVQRGLRIVGTLENLVTQTKKASSVIVQQADRERLAEGSVSAGTIDDPRLSGPFFASKQTLTLVDINRKSTANPSGRRIPVDIYLPTARLIAPPQSSPVIVISHGLASDRSTFAYLAQHLASHGFAVLVPEHPGSNAKQLEALIRGTTSEISEPTEFVNRPLDITFLLDQMELQATETPFLKGRLNLQQVGVIGQSFGGYTALALGGASINEKKLQQDCRDLQNNFNLSLLLQCRAEKLTLGQSNQLRDRRVKAVIALNPITSAVFGQAGVSQIQVPTMILTGNADTVAPSLWEQIQPFTWLTTPNRYLVMLDGGTHFSTLSGADRGEGLLPIPVEVVGPNPAIARRYVSPLTLAFFKTYLANQSAYRSYLSAGYADAISESPMPLNLVRSLTAEQLASGSTDERRSQLPPATR